jgi:4'-phosphopantetheinyl transferase
MQSDVAHEPAVVGTPCHLRTGEVLIQTAIPTETTEEEASWLCKNLLSDAESSKAARFFFAQDRHEYIVACALVRLGLSRLFAMHPSELQLDRDERGKPFIVKPKTATHTEFSISHTRGLVALLVTPASHAGVDVEKISPAADLGLVAESVLAPMELACLSQLSSAAWTARFIELWTLKEAYAKARGLGLALPLKSVAFDIKAEGHVVASFAPEIQDKPDCWHFWLRRTTPDHVMAAAIRVEPRQACEFSVRPVTVRAGQGTGWLAPVK